MCEYLLEVVTTEKKSKIVLNTTSLKEVKKRIIDLKIKSRNEQFKEVQWFPYGRLVAIKPSGKLRFLKFNFEQLQLGKRA